MDSLGKTLDELIYEFGKYNPSKGELDIEYKPVIEYEIYKLLEKGRK